MPTNSPFHTSSRLPAYNVTFRMNDDDDCPNGTSLQRTTNRRSNGFLVVSKLFQQANLFLHSFITCFFFSFYLLFIS